MAGWRCGGCEGGYPVYGAMVAGVASRDISGHTLKHLTAASHSQLISKHIKL